MGIYFDATTGSSIDTLSTVSGFDTSATFSGTFSGTIQAINFNSTITASSGVTWMGPIMTTGTSTDSWNGYVTESPPIEKPKTSEMKLDEAIKNPVIDQFIRNVREAKIIMEGFKEAAGDLSEEDKTRLEYARRSMEDAMELIDARTKDDQENIF